MRLFRFEKRWLATICEAILPAGGDPRLPLGARDIPTNAFADALLQYAPLTFVFGVRAAIWVVFWCPLLLLGRFRTFAGLAEKDRVRSLILLGRSSIYFLRELPVLLKMVATLAYCALPAVQRHVGYERVDESPPFWARRDGGGRGGGR